MAVEGSFVRPRCFFENIVYQNILNVAVT